MSINGINQEKNSTENIRRTLDIQGEKLNEITTNNRQVCFLFFILIIIINKIFS